MVIISSMLERDFSKAFSSLSINMDSHQFVVIFQARVPAVALLTLLVSSCCTTLSAQCSLLSPIRTSYVSL